eukprot:g12056.t1
MQPPRAASSSKSHPKKQGSRQTEKEQKQDGEKGKGASKKVRSAKAKEAGKTGKGEKGKKAEEVAKKEKEEKSKKTKEANKKETEAASKKAKEAGAKTKEKGQKGNAPSKKAEKTNEKQKANEKQEDAKRKAKEVKNDCVTPPEKRRRFKSPDASVTTEELERRAQEIAAKRLASQERAEKALAMQGDLDSAFKTAREKAVFNAAGMDEFVDYCRSKHSDASIEEALRKRAAGEKRLKEKPALERLAPPEDGDEGDEAATEEDSAEERSGDGSDEEEEEGGEDEGEGDDGDSEAGDDDDEKDEEEGGETMERRKEKEREREKMMKKEKEAVRQEKMKMRVKVKRIIKTRSPLHERLRCASLARRWHEAVIEPSLWAQLVPEPEDLACLSSLLKRFGGSVRFLKIASHGPFRLRWRGRPVDQKSMGCHVAKYWAAGSCAPLVDETAEEDLEERWCCRFFSFHRHHTRDMEVVIEPSSESSHPSHVDPRSPPGRDVHVGFPVIEESPKSTSLSQSRRQRFSWPLSISAHHVDKALRSGANVYLPPRCLGDSPLVIFTAQKVNTRLCTMEEYQMLIMFMLETAFKDSCPDHDRGVTVVLDVRHLSSVVWQAFLSGFSDMARGIAMCSAALPMKASHVQLIEDEAVARIAHYAIGLVLSKLSSKTRSRVIRGGPDAALQTLGKEILPDFLGGQRNSVGEFSGWLEQLELADACQIAASACVGSSAL